jgi:hypothetical protein
MFMLWQAFIDYVKCLFGFHKWVLVDDFGGKYYERCPNCAKAREPTFKALAE